MTKRTVWGIAAVVAGLALVVSGVATASNMGFKFVPQIPGAAGANAFNLSLPWNNNYTDAKSLIDDIPGAEKVVRVESNGAFTNWIPGLGGTRFPIVKGDAYLVYGTGAGQTPVIVGSHDPNFTFNFTPGLKNAGAPYHQTLTDARSLINSLNGHCSGAFDKVVRIEPTSAFTNWIPGLGGTNFPLELGKGVLISATANCNGYVWPHY